MAEIRLDDLRALYACAQALNAFAERWPSGRAPVAEVVSCLHEARRPDWESWLLGNSPVVIVRALLAEGADIHAGGDGALRWAAGRGHAAVVRLLLAKGADLHARGDLALYVAADGGHLAVVRLLEAASKREEKRRER